MTVSAATLRELHRLHSQLTDLRGRLERGPKQIQARKANVAKLEADVAAAHELVKQTKLAADRKQLDMKASEQKVVDWNARLNSASSNKEYQTMREQIAAAEMAGSVLEDETLELLGRIDELEAAAKQTEGHLANGKEELAKVTAQVEENADKLRSEIARLEGDLAAAEGTLSGDFKGEYERVIRNKGAEGMAEAEEGVCTGCGQQITLNMQNNLALSQPTFCQACGCLLYLPEP